MFCNILENVCQLDHVCLAIQVVVVFQINDEVSVLRNNADSKRQLRLIKGQTNLGICLIFTTF